MRSPLCTVLALLHFLTLGGSLFGEGDVAPPPPPVSPEDGQRIEEALPARAPATPGRARTLLIFDRNVGYGGHPSIAYAAHAFTRLGEKTGAFRTVLSRDPEMFRPENLRAFDAVFLNNTVGNLFTDSELRQSLIDFVYGGGGLLGVHGTTVAFTRWPGAHEDWPEFGRLLGARGANHRDSRERVVIRLDDPAHPLTRVFGGEGFEFSDEFFRVQDPYSRERVRVLLSIDTQRTDLTQGVARGQVERADQDYALAWVRRYGRGRVAYCTIAHNPYVFWDTRMLEFYLATLQFVLGDLPAPTTPSARLTPAVRARETLSWTLGLASARGTVLEAIDEAAKLRLTSVSLSAGQPFNGTNMTGFGPGLGAAERELLRFKLDEAGLRVDACELAAWPADATAARSWFAFARTFGLQLVAAPVTPNELPAADALCREFDLNLAIPAAALQPARLSRVLESCSSHVGVAIDPGAWGGADIDVAEAVRALGGRILLVQMGQSPIKNVAPQARLGPILDALHRQGVHPLLINLRQAALPADPAFPRLVEAIDGLCLRLAPEH